MTDRPIPEVPDNPLTRQLAEVEAMQQGGGRRPTVLPPPSSPVIHAVAEALASRADALRRGPEAAAPPSSPSEAIPYRTPLPASGSHLSFFIGIDLINNVCMGDNGEVFELWPEEVKGLQKLCLHAWRRAMGERFVALAKVAEVDMKEFEVPGGAPAETTPQPDGKGEGKGA